MNFEKLKTFAITQDNRNKFGKSDKISKIVPKSLELFYREYNPIDVEVDIDGVAVRFYPVDELEQLQKNYTIPSAFIFASCNSDPIFISKNKVYTCPHGVANPKWELISNSILQEFGRGSI